MPTASTVGGWAAVLAVGAGWWYINQKNIRNRRPTSSKPPAKPEVRKEPKTKKARKDGVQSGGDQDPKKSQATQKKKSVPAKGEEDQVWKGADSDKDEVDNREFARQLSNAKTGTVMKSSAQATSRPKSVKQTRAQEKAVVETSSDNATAPSSTTGGDADDDQSPINSPELSSTKIASGFSNGVSDMLEKPAPGPSVLRVTAPTNPSPPKKAKPQTTFEPVETKKQRQNRKKTEAKKLEREEDEKVRKVLMEKQRRTAREAEGRAAKDGSAFMASKAPSNSAWAAPVASTNGTKAASNSNTDLLDTYEPSSSKSAAKPEEEVYSDSQIAGSGMLSEEEQMALAVEQSRNANWEIVKTKEKRNRANKAASKENEKPKADKPSSTDEQEYGVPPRIAPTGPGKRWAMNLVHVDDNGKVVETETEVQDSEWEVA